jgi:RHS repeat-associated protein
MLARLARTSLFLLVLSFVSRQSMAQQQPSHCEVGPGCLNDTQPPQVTLSPGSGTVSRASVLVTVSVWDDVGFGSNHPAILLNGKMEDLSTWQGSTATGVLSKTLVLTPGVNTVHAEICDQVPTCGSADATLTYEPSYGVLVTPDGGVKGLAPAAAGSQVFTITNTSPATARYLLALSCTGRAASCSLPVSEVSLAAGASGTVTASFTVGAAGASGFVELAAQDADNARTKNRGWVEVVPRSTTGTPSAPVIDVAGHNPGTSLARDLCVTVRVGAAADAECGDLRLVHGLPAVRTMSRTRAPVLVYGSQTAQPAALVAAGVTLPAGASTPDRVVASLRVGGVLWTTQEWSGSEWSASMRRRILLRYAGAELATGLYDYALEVTNWYGTVPRSTTVNGQLLVVDRRRSPFGQGWWLAGVERLHYVPADSTVRLWVGGDGSAQLYRKARAGVWGAATLDRPDTLRFANGEYVRELPHGVRVFFDPYGRHTRTRNRLGHVTEFHYSTDPTYGERLDSIRVPAPGRALASHVFTYTPVSGALGARFRLDSLSSYPAVAGQPRRRVTLAHAHGDSRITGITDPDQRTVQLAYEDPAAPERITRRTDRRGYSTRFDFDAVGKVAASRAEVGGGKPDVVLRISAGESLGAVQSVLHDTAGGGTSKVYTLIDGPRTDVQDEVQVEIDGRGQPVAVRDPFGYQTLVQREDPRFPALATRVQYPNWRVLRSTYDARGNVTEIWDEKVLRPTDVPYTPVATRYAWDATWDFVTKIVDPEQNASPQADSTTFTYDPANGNRLSVTDPSGRTATFSYVAATGLPWKVTSPEGRVDEVGYDTASVNLGNLAWTRSPSGIVSRVQTDLLGRVRYAYTPIDSAGAQVQTTETVYDLMGRVLESRSNAPQLQYEKDHLNDNQDETGTVPAEGVLVTSTYDEEGNPLTTTRSGTRNGGAMPTGVGALVTRWAYDGLGRVLSETSPDNQAEGYTYDPAGNVVQRLTRRGFVIRSEYDAAGRLVRKIVPGITHAAKLDRPGNLSGETLPWRFPRFVANGAGALEVENTASYSLLMDRETSEYAYDEMGNLVSAVNPWARVTRSWNTNGTLAADTLQIAPYTGAMQPGLHTYGIRYGYDLAGRLVSMRHPGTLAPRPQGVLKDMEGYEYDANGRLKAVTNVLGGRYTFTYHPDGPVQEMVTPTGYRTTWAYNADGQLRRRTETAPAGSPITLLHDDLFRYDGRGKMTAVETVGGRVRNAYSGLGTLAWSLTEDGEPMDVTGFSEELYDLDALGNAHSSWTHRKPAQQDAVMPSTQSYSYESSTGRLQTVSGNKHRLFSESFGGSTSYDVAGNTGRTEEVLSGSDVRKVTWSFYDAEDRLRVLDRRACEFWVDGGGGIRCNRFGVPQKADYSTFEEFRYDALGRRIFARTRQDWNCGSGNNTCDNTVRRFVWNGDALLYEIRYPGQTGISWQEMERDTGLVFSSAQPPMYGRVAYTNGPEIDRPLDFIRMNISPNLPEPEVIYPHRNWGGQIDRLSFFDGTGERCSTMAQPSGGRCIYAEPPASSLSLIYGRMGSQSGFWIGGQLDNMRDASGLVYMRNRYYDPETGRFTQEDPIGLAGGINLYGYANGDPVSYSDPFGLKVCAKGLRAQRALQNVMNADIEWDKDGCVDDDRKVHPRPRRRKDMYADIELMGVFRQMIWNDRTITLVLEPAPRGIRGCDFNTSCYDEVNNIAYVDPADTMLMNADGFVYRDGVSYRGCGFLKTGQYTLDGLVAHEFIGHGSGLPLRGVVHRHPAAFGIENLYHRAVGGTERCR